MFSVKTDLYTGNSGFIENIFRKLLIETQLHPFHVSVPISFYSFQYFLAICWGNLRFTEIMGKLVWTGLCEFAQSDYQLNALPQQIFSCSKRWAPISQYPTLQQSDLWTLSPLQTSHSPQYLLISRDPVPHFHIYY